MKKLLYIILAVAVVGMLALLNAKVTLPEPTLQGRGECEFASATNTSTTINTTTTPVLSLNRNRCYAALQNCGTTEITIAFKNTTTTWAEGVVLAAGTPVGATYEILTNENPYIGQINAIASSSAGKLCIIESS